MTTKPQARRTFRRGALGPALVVAMMGCEVGSPVNLVVEQALAPLAGSCTFIGASGLISSGFYDPSGQNGFALGVTMRNTMEDETFDSVTITDATENQRPEANVVNLTGFDTCFYREDDPSLSVTELGDKGEAIVDCNSLPEGQRRFVPAAGTLTPEEAAEVVTLVILEHEDLRMLYGEDFLPERIPIIGPFQEDTNGDGNANGDTDAIRYSFRAQSPIRADHPGGVRPSAWGNYPESYESRVIVQLKARGKLLTGQTVESNEFHFPVLLSVGTVLDACMHPTLIQCSGLCVGCSGNYPQIQDQRRCVVAGAGDCGAVCTDGTGCLQFGFVGVQPTVAGACLAFQDATPVACVEINQCGDFN